MSVQHDRTKHIEIDRHFIKKKLNSGLIRTPYFSNDLDILTKGLSSTTFQVNIFKLRMENIYLPT